MPTPALTADSARVSVMRPLASSAYGKRTVTLPEGVKPEDVFTVSAPGNEPGFVAMLAPKKRTGGFARRFIRADVNVTAVDMVNPDVVPDSDTSRVLTEARDRVTSAFFLESDISKAGLGAWVPYEDFTLGDYAWISIFGHRVKLPVTRIEPLITDHSVVDWKVHVGGQLVSDEQARMVENEAVHKAVVEDRRELAGLNAKASSAVSTAESAQADASTALSEVRDKRGVIQGYVEQAEAAVAAGREHNAAAEERLAESRTVLDGAVGKLAEAEKLLDESDLALEENKKLKEAIERYRDGIEKLLVEARTLNAGARQASATAAAHGAQTLAILSEAEGLHAQVAGLLDEAAQQVAQGKRHLDDSRRLAQAGEKARVDAVAAAEKAGKLAEQAETALNSVKGEREQVAKLLKDVQGQKTAADKALADAGGLLSQAKKAASDAGQSKDAVDALYRQVVDKHGEVLNLHQEMITAQAEINAKQQTILDAHEEAIKLTARGVRALAGSQAAMAGSLAYFEQCLEASNRAIDAVAEATELNTQAIKRLDEVARLHEEAIREQVAMTEQLRLSTERLAATDETIIKTQDNLKASQALIQTQTENNSKALDITNRAVRAHGGAIGGMAASISMLQESQEETQKATEQALSAAQSNTSAIRAQEAVGRARDEAVMAATEVATSARAIALAARYAAEVNAVAIRNGEKRDQYQDAMANYSRAMSSMLKPKYWVCHNTGQTFHAGAFPQFAEVTVPSRKNVVVKIKGTWTGGIRIRTKNKSGKGDFSAAWIERGVIDWGPQYFGDKRTTFCDAGALEEVDSADVIVYANTSSDGSVPQEPPVPTYEPVPPIPDGLKQN